MINTGFKTVIRKKALNNQSFISEEKSTGIEIFSTHTTKGTPIRDVDITTVLFLRQPCACGGKSNTVIRGMVMFALIETFMNSTQVTQGATLFFLLLLIYGSKQG